MSEVCDKRCQSNRPNSTRNPSVLRRRLKNLSQRFDQTRSQVTQLREQAKELQKQLDRSKQQLHLAQAQLVAQMAQEQVMQPDRGVQGLDERPLPEHQFSSSIIALSIELAKRTGFRAAADALQIMFDFMGIDRKVPSHDAIEQWTLRTGASLLKDTFKPNQRVLWMADHSAQIGSERVLLILGIALDDLPPPGETLDFDKIKVLAIVPGVSWKTADVAREYQKLAKKIGAPVYLLCDGASELRDAAKTLEKDGKPTIVLGDLKHYAANVLEKEIGNSQRFKEFLSQVTLTRSRIQQTELSHFTPPTQRQKSRFMNLGPLLRWAAMVLHHLAQHNSQARQNISQDRMQAKLGWLREYAQDILRWCRCQDVIDCSLEVINLQGLEAKTAEAVEAALDQRDPDWRNGETSSGRIGQLLVNWIRESADKLHANDRAWLSTEIVESLFGSFKQLERQHSKGGFTRLIAAFPTLCTKVTAEVIKKCFRQFNANDLRKWLNQHLGNTFSKLRQLAYREFALNHHAKAQTTN